MWKRDKNKGKKIIGLSKEVAEKILIDKKIMRNIFIICY